MNDIIRVVSPNLPIGKVSSAFIDCRMKQEFKTTLQNFGINLIEVQKSTYLDTAISAHPDMSFLNIAEGVWYSPVETYVLNKFKSDNFIKEIQKIIISSIKSELLKYPNDAQLNALVIGETLICNTKAINREVLNKCENMDYRIIHVNQGYTKCSICVVSGNAVITEDEGIYKVLSNEGFDVLLLKQKAVSLPPYKNGFIGGASGKLSKNILAFCGDIKMHPEYEKIKLFCNNYSVDLLSLGTGMLCDYGSILPISLYL